MVAASTLRHKYDITMTEDDLRFRRLELHFYEQAALERASRLGLESHVRCFMTFCRSANMAPFPLCYENVGLYLVQYCQRFGHTTRSIPSIMSHLNRANRERGHDQISMADKYRLDDAIKGLQKHDRSAPQRKMPMTQAVLQAIQAKANLQLMRHFQHITMCRVAHDALMRGTELLGLLAGHLLWNSDRTQVTITIHLSKANKTGPAEQVTLSDYGPSSAVAFLREYVRIMGIDNHPLTLPLWPKVHTSGAVDRSQVIPKTEFIALLRTLLSEAGYPPAKFSGHSFRSGGATDLWGSKCCRPQTIKLFGRWRSEAFWLYVRDNPNLRAVEVATAFATIDQHYRPNVSVLAATALASHQFGK